MSPRIVDDGVCRIALHYRVPDGKRLNVSCQKCVESRDYRFVGINSRMPDVQQRQFGASPARHPHDEGADDVAVCRKVYRKKNMPKA
jgi:hypothetical protein